MFPDCDDPASSGPRSSQPSAIRSDGRQQEKAGNLHSDFARHIERRSATPDRGDLQTSAEHDLSSDDSDEEKDESRLTRARRANTLSKGYTEDEEAVVIKTFDRKLVLFLAFLYLLSFLDRSSMHFFSRNMTTSDRRRHWKCKNRWA